jgi:1,4-dihydroxy-2-naphthoate octaprenyltransferase
LNARNLNKSGKIGVDKAGLRDWAAATRPFAFSASALGVLVGTAAAARIPQWRWDVLAAELVAVVLMHAIGNLLNDYYDYLSGVDARTEDDEGRPGRFLVKGILLPKDVLRLVLILSIPLAPMGALLIRIGGWPVAAIAVVGLLGAYAYTGPPFALKYRRLGELCIFIVYGPAVVIGAGYMQALKVTPKMLLYSILLGMLITAIVSANNLRDIEEDGRAKVRTLACVLGRKIYLPIYLALMFGPAAIIIGLVVSGAAPAWLLLGLLALPIGLAPARFALLNIRRPDADALTAKYMTAFGGLIFLALVLAGAP